MQRGRVDDKTPCGHGSPLPGLLFSGWTFVEQQANRILASSQQLDHTELSLPHSVSFGRLLAGRYLLLVQNVSLFCLFWFVSFRQPLFRWVDKWFDSVQVLLLCFHRFVDGSELVCASQMFAFREPENPPRGENPRHPFWFMLFIDIDRVDMTWKQQIDLIWHEVTERHTETSFHHTGYQCRADRCIDHCVVWLRVFSVMTESTTVHIWFGDEILQYTHRNGFLLQKFRGRIRFGGGLVMKFCKVLDQNQRFCRSFGLTAMAFRCRNSWENTVWSRFGYEILLWLSVAEIQTGEMCGTWESSAMIRAERLLRCVWSSVCRFQVTQANVSISANCVGKLSYS